MSVEQQAPHDDASRSAVEAEFAALCATPEFVRAPVMRRLLDYLLQETLAGRGDQVKAYSVAVDGLGRDPDFDTQADSYPRVQVGRLRRMLDAHYARHPLTSGVGISIPNGSYKVHFFAPGEPATPKPPPDPDVRRPDAGGRLGWILAVLATLALLAVAIFWLALSPLRTLATSEMIPNPTLELSRIATDETPQALRLRDRVEVVLGNTLHRSFIRTTQPGGGEGMGAPDYRLSGRVMVTAEGPSLFLQLHHVETSRQIWSQSLALPAGDASVEAALGPTIAQLIQPFGVIASDLRARQTNPAAAGFPCQMLFHDYRRTLDPALAATVTQCLERSSRLNPNNVGILAARSFMAFDASRAPGVNAARLREKGFALAHDAVRVAPFNGVGHLALAHAFYVDGHCDLGKAAALRSVEINRYNAEKLGILGTFMFQCNDPDAEHYLREAIALDPNSPATVRLPLVILLIRRNERAEALSVANRMVPPMDSTRPFYDLSIALAETANGRSADAAKAWADVVAAAGGQPGRVDKLIERHFLSPDLRRAVLTALTDAKLLKPDELPSRP